MVRLALGLVLTGLIYVGWQMYLEFQEASALLDPYDIAEDEDE
jgi:hypothetical protein